MSLFSLLYGIYNSRLSLETEFSLHITLVYICANIRRSPCGAQNNFGEKKIRTKNCENSRAKYNNHHIAPMRRKNNEFQMFVAFEEQFLRFI